MQQKSGNMKSKEKSGKKNKTWQKRKNMLRGIRTEGKGGKITKKDIQKKWEEKLRKK